MSGDGTEGGEGGERGGSGGRGRWPPDWLSRALVAALLLGALIMAFVDGGSGGGSKLPVGSEAPPFVLQRHGGGTVALAGLAGEVVLLDFWATWCPACVSELPSLLELAEAYGPRGLVFVAASEDDAEDRPELVERFVQRRPGLRAYAAYSAPRVSEAYRVAALPTLYVIGRDGRVAFSAVGGVAASTLRQAIDAALAAPRPN